MAVEVEPVPLVEPVLGHVEDHCLHG
jgi:hypothetical protein